MDLCSLSNQDLIDRLRGFVRQEREATAAVIEYIKEVDMRKLYLEYGRTSLFSFLTQDLGYPPACAQRRIDAARLMRAVPEIKDDLEKGLLNLTQVSLMAQGLRDKKDEPVDKKELLDQIKGQNIAST